MTNKAVCRSPRPGPCRQGHMPITSSLSRLWMVGSLVKYLSFATRRMESSFGPTRPTPREGIGLITYFALPLRVGCWLQSVPPFQKSFITRFHISGGAFDNRVVVFDNQGRGIRQLRAVSDNRGRIPHLVGPVLWNTVLDARPTLQGLCTVQVGSRT